MGSLPEILSPILNGAHFLLNATVVALEDNLVSVNLIAARNEVQPRRARRQTAGVHAHSRGKDPREMTLVRKSAFISNLCQRQRSGEKKLLGALDPE